MTAAQKASLSRRYTCRIEGANFLNAFLLSMIPAFPNPIDKRFFSQRLKIRNVP